MSKALKWWISFGHALLLLLLTLVWLNSDYMYGDEQSVIQRSSLMKHLLMGSGGSVPKKDLLFINLAYDKALVPLENSLGNEVITDRAKLAEFFGLIKEHPGLVKFVLCDVFLKGRSPHDSLLENSIKGLDNVIFPAHFDNEGQLEKTDVSAPLGIADYSRASKGFLKFRLVQSDSLPTIPVVMLNRLDKRNIVKKKGWYIENGHCMLNSMVIDYQIRPAEMQEGGKYAVLNLSDLLVLPKEVILAEFLKDKIVVMGDFDHDVHDTVAGSAPGTLILLNIYLSLKDGLHFINWYWLAFMILAFMVFSRIMLFPRKDNLKVENIKWVGPLLASATYLSLLSICSHLLFSVPIQVLFITVYMNSLRYLINLSQVRWNIKTLKEWFIGWRDTYFNLK